MDKPRNNGDWSEARFRSFIVSALRAATSRWGPKALCIKNARVRHGVYRCSSCCKEGPKTLPPLPGNKRRRKNIVADHISAIVAPEVGFVDWDTWVERAFVELEGFQALCWACHSKKSSEERAIATARRAKEKRDDV